MGGDPNHLRPSWGDPPSRRTWLTETENGWNVTEMRRTKAKDVMGPPQSYSGHYDAWGVGKMWVFPKIGVYTPKWMVL